jgi:hypothetical protein
MAEPTFGPARLEDLPRLFDLVNEAYAEHESFFKLTHRLIDVGELERGVCCAVRASGLTLP